MNKMNYMKKLLLCILVCSFAQVRSRPPLMDLEFRSTFDPCTIFELRYFVSADLKKRLELLYSREYAEKEALEKSHLLYKNIEQCSDGNENSCDEARRELNRINKEDEKVHISINSKQGSVAFGLFVAAYPENHPTQEDFEALANLDASFEIKK